MNMSDAVTLIQGVGFPIAACVAMYILQLKLNKTHKEEVDSLRTSLEQNTLAIQKLTDKMDS